jgi:outer membrane biosynthesis protein TonB
MIHNDRDRLVLGVGVALLFHTVLFIVLTLVGFDFTPYPETEPVYVTLPEYDPPEVAELEETQPVEQPATEESLQEADESDQATTEQTVPTEPVPEEPTPQEQPEPAEPATPPRPEPSVRSDPSPEAPPAAADSVQSAMRDAPPGSFTTEDLPWLSDDAREERARSRTASDDLFAIDEPDDVDQELPSWVIEGEFSMQPESTLDEDAQETLETKRETVPGFSERLSELMSALDDPSQPGQAGTQAAADEADSRPGATGPATTSLPGGSTIEWVGGGSRRPVGELALPNLSATDFGGQVPARVSYLIVFEVNEDGLVVPGSLILRQSSGYTLADQKVRRAVSTWRFDPAPGTPPVTAIATLHISRDRIR